MQMGDENRSSACATCEAKQDQADSTCRACVRVSRMTVAGCDGDLSVLVCLTAMLTLLMGRTLADSQRVVPPFPPSVCPAPDPIEITAVSTCRKNLTVPYRADGRRMPTRPRGTARVDSYGGTE